MTPRNPPPITPTVAGARTVVQAGFSVSGILYALQVFGVTDLTAEQVLALTPILAGAGAFAMRLIENRTGRGFLRRVP